MNKYLISKGCGASIYELTAFDNALIDAGIGDYNLVKLSSILPAGCTQVNLINIKKGSFLHTAYSCYIESKPETTISAAVAIALPQDKRLPGVIVEVAGAYDNVSIEYMVREMADITMKSRKIKEYDIQNESISMTTKDGFNCVVAAVSIW